MYEQIFISILNIFNFVSVRVSFYFPKRNLCLKNKHLNDLEFSKCANIERCTQLG